MVLKWNTKAKRYELDSEYHERHVPKGAGFRWDHVKKRWWTVDVICAEKLSRYADEATAKRLDEALEKHEADVEASRATETDMEIPAPVGLEYRGFQKAAIAYCVKHKRALNASEMGLGKSVETIGVINADPTIKRVLVICPATLKLNWKYEAGKWLVRPMSVGVANAGGEWPGTDIVIINYAILDRWPEIKETKWDLVVVDESQATKNRKTKRAKLVRAIAKDVPRVLLLTGTPILNRPVELFNQINILDPKSWGSWWDFTGRYCGRRDTQWGLDVSGATRLDELSERLAGTVMVRHLKKDVLTELPPKIRQVIEISNGVREDRSGLEKLKVAIADTEGADGYEAAVNRLKEHGAVFAEITRIRHETALKKVPYVIKHVEGLLETTEKICVWAHHHDVIFALMDGLREYGAVKLDGRDSQKERAKAIDRFQNDPGIRVFIGGIQAAGVGITLTAASTAVFAELDWTPAVISQCEDRQHRLGQTDSVIIHHVVVDNSIDAQLAKTIVRKQKIIDAAMGDKVVRTKMKDVRVPAS